MWKSLPNTLVRWPPFYAAKEYSSVPSYTFYKEGKYSIACMEKAFVKRDSS
jgi:hypothetical protein